MRDDDVQGSDHRISEAYQRLGTVLAPLPDVVVGIERRISARRRRRRTALAGGAALLLGGAVGGAVLLGSGQAADPDRVATDSPTARPAEHGGFFTFTRPDGSRTVIDDLRLSCARTPEGRPAEPGHLYLWSPIRLNASGDRLVRPYVSFDALAQEADGKDYILPIDRTGTDRGHGGVLLYAAEASHGRSDRSNEVSSAQDGASGTISVVHASCTPTATLDLEVHTELASEVGQGTLEVTGSYR